MENCSATFIRLKTGDDIVCECYEYSDDRGDYVTVINPLKAVYVSGGTGYLQVAFTPWVYPRICEIQEFNILKSDILLMENVTDYMNDYYWSTLESLLNDKREEETEDELKDKFKEALEELEQLTKKVYH